MTNKLKRVGSKLKPCPFCGSEACLIPRTLENCVSVFCKNLQCCAEISFRHIIYSTKKLTKLRESESIRETIETWNKRTS